MEEDLYSRSIIEVRNWICSFPFTIRYERCLDFSYESLGGTHFPRLPPFYESVNGRSRKQEKIHRFLAKCSFHPRKGYRVSSESTLDHSKVNKSHFPFLNALQQRLEGEYWSVALVLSDITHVIFCTLAREVSEYQLFLIAFLSFLVLLSLIITIHAYINSILPWLSLLHLFLALCCIGFFALLFSDLLSGTA